MSTASYYPHILIVYYSRFGSLRQLAEQVAAGARQTRQSQVTLLEVEDRPIVELRPGEDAEQIAQRCNAVLNQMMAAEALIVGAPSYFGSMASPIKRLFEDAATGIGWSSPDRTRPWRLHLFRHKVGAAFTGSATPHGGNEQTLHSILTMLMHLGMIVVTPGQALPILENETAPYGATVVTGATGDQPPGDAEQRMAQALGAQVAEITTWLHLGRLEAERPQPLPWTPPPRPPRPSGYPPPF